MKVLSGKSAACLNCCAFVFAFFPVTGVFFLWGFRHLEGSNTIVYGTGPFVLSGAIVTGARSGRIDRFRWGKVTSEEACSNTASNNNLYSNWSGRYGFCSAEDGVFTVPAEIKAIEAFMILGLIFLFITVLVGCTNRSIVGHKSGADEQEQQGHRKYRWKLLVGLLTINIFVVLFTIIVCVLIVTFPWYQDLRRPQSPEHTAYLPLRLPNGTLYAQAVADIHFHYGPSFAAHLFVFCVCFISVVLYGVLLVKHEPPAPREYFGGYDFENAQEEVEKQMQVT